MVLAPLNNPPEPLHRLLVEDEHFRINIRKYNSVFSFTSLGVHVDEDLASARNGTYTFRIQGQLHHKIGSLIPNENEEAKFAQIYFYDLLAPAKRSERQQLVLL